MRFIISGDVTDSSDLENIFVSNFETPEVQKDGHQVHLMKVDEPIKYKQISEDKVTVGFKGKTYELAYRGESIKIPYNETLVLQLWLNRIAD